MVLTNLCGSHSNNAATKLAGRTAGPLRVSYSKTVFSYSTQVCVPFFSFSFFKPSTLSASRSKVVQQDLEFGAGL